MSWSSRVCRNEKSPLETSEPNCSDLSLYQLGFLGVCRKALEGLQISGHSGNFTSRLLCRRRLDKDRQGLRGKTALSSITHHPSHSALGSLCVCLKQHESNVQQKIKHRHSFVCLQTAGTPFWPIQCETSFLHSIFLNPSSFFSPSPLYSYKETCFLQQGFDTQGKNSHLFSVFVSALLPRPADCRGSISLPL